MTRTVAIVVVAIAAAGCRTTRGGVAAQAGPAFPLRLDAARATGRVVTLEYTLTNDSGHDVWAACPDSECAVPGTRATRLDGVTPDGTVLRLSSRIVPEERGLFTTWPERVPFRRIAPGESRWRAVYDLSGEAARAIACAAGPVTVELSIGILSCAEPDLLPPLERTDVHLAGPGARVDCAGRERPVLEVQQVTTATRTLTLEGPPRAR
jgi:hypothetical protein